MKRLSKTLAGSFVALLLAGPALAQSTDEVVPAGDDTVTAGDQATSADNAEDRRDVAWCVGGPRQPSFAFNDYNQAQRCFNRVQSFGQDCRRAARIDRCDVYRRYDIGRVRPYDCTCGGGFGAVGNWLR